MGSMLKSLRPNPSKTRVKRTSPRHFSTHRNRNIRGFPGVHSHFDQSQDRRVQRIIQIVDFIVHPVNGQGILDQIVGPDG